MYISWGGVGGIRNFAPVPFLLITKMEGEGRGIGSIVKEMKWFGSAS